MNIFQAKYASVFYDGADHLGMIFFGMGYDFISLQTKHAREQASIVTSELLRFNIIEVLNFGSFEWLFNDMKLTIIQKQKIASNMMHKAEKNELSFDHMMYFQYSEWYWNELQKLNLNMELEKDRMYLGEVFIPKIEIMAKQRLSVNK